MVFLETENREQAHFFLFHIWFAETLIFWFTAFCSSILIKFILYSYEFKNKFSNMNYYTNLTNNLYHDFKNYFSTSHAFCREKPFWKANMLPPLFYLVGMSSSGIKEEPNPTPAISHSGKENSVWLIKLEFFLAD